MHRQSRNDMDFRVSQSLYEVHQCNHLHKTVFICAVYTQKQKLQSVPQSWKKSPCYLSACMSSSTIQLHWGNPCGLPINFTTHLWELRLIPISPKFCITFSRFIAPHSTKVFVPFTNSASTQIHSDIPVWTESTQFTQGSYQTWQPFSSPLSVSCHSILHVQIGFHWKPECATHIPCATRSMQGKFFLHCHLLYLLYVMITWSQGKSWMTSYWIHSNK